MKFFQQPYAFGRSTIFSAVYAVFVVVARGSHGQEALRPAVANAALQVEFHQQVRPFLTKYCVDCHNADEMESGIRVDHLGGNPDDRQLYLWQGILKQIAENAMPPEDAPQPTAD